MKEQTDRTHLYLSAFILNLNYFLVGMGFAWSSPVLEKLSLTPTEGSTVAACLPLGSILGPFVAGVLLDRLGRKFVILLSLIMAIIAILILIFFPTFIPLSAARFILGIHSGVMYSSVPIYIAEISEDSIRGSLNTLITAFSGCGGLLVYSVGPFVSYAILHYIILGIALLVCLLIPLLPRSPHFMIMNNNVESAKKSLAWLRWKTSPTLIESELLIIRTTLQASQEGKGSIFDLFRSAGNRKALFICCTLMMVVQCSGITVLNFYTQQIFEMTGTNISSSSCSIIIGAIMMIASLFSPLSVKRFGYKKSLLISASGMTLGMGGLSIFFMLKSNLINVNELSWLPLLSCVIYNIFVNIGFSTIPIALTGELFPTEVKSFAATFAMIVAGGFSFLTTILFAGLVLRIGQGPVFMICSFFSIFGGIFTLFVVKDTSGKSFAEIQDMLNGRKKSLESIKERNLLV